MKKRVPASIAVVIGLTLSLLVATPAQAATDWASFKSELESSTSGAVVTLNNATISTPSGTPTIAVSTDKTITLTGTNTLDYNMLSAIFVVFAGATLTINGGGTLSINYNSSYFSGRAMFIGSGAVVIANATTVAAGSLSVWSGPGTLTVAAGGTVSFTQEFSIASGPVTINGAVSTPNGLTLASYTNVTVGSTGTVTAGSLTIGASSFVNNGTVNVTNDIGVDGGVTTTSPGDFFSTTGTLYNSGVFRFSGTLDLGGATHIQNSGSIVPLPGSSFTAAGVDGNNTVFDFGATPYADLPALAPTIEDAEQQLPWDTSWVGFTGWATGGAKVFATTPLPPDTVAAVTLTPTFSTFSTATPTPGVLFTGLTDGLPTSTYTWYVDSVPKSPVSTPTYTPFLSEAGLNLTLEISTPLPGYTPATSVSFYDFGDIAGTFTTAPPVVTGLPAVGSTLVADGSASFTPAPSTYDYEWFSNGTSVGTGTTYLVHASDLGNTIKVVVTGTGSAFGTATAEKSVGPVTAEPVMSLSKTTATVGETIIVTVPGLAPSTDYDLEIHSTPAPLGTFQTNGAGLLSATVIIPLGTSPGSHSIVLFDSNGNRVTSAALTVNPLAALAATGATALMSLGGMLAAGLLALGAITLITRRRITS